jgi:hypothetical protein
MAAANTALASSRHRPMLRIILGYLKREFLDLNSSNPQR